MIFRQIPNLLTLGRMLLVWPVVESLRSGRFELAMLLFFVAAASDGLDGYLARRFDWRTRLGGFLDPAADKLLMLSMYITLWSVDRLPTLLVLLVLVRDVVIVTGVLVMRLRIGAFDAAPRIPSKLNTVLLATFGLMVLADAAWSVVPDVVLESTGALLLVTTVVSGLDYVLTWGQRMVRTREEGEGHG